LRKNDRKLLATDELKSAAMQDSENSVRESFARQTFMMFLGASLSRVAPGEVDIELPFRADLCQQNGTVHAGALTAIADSACGYAALTLMPEGSNVLSVEFKINLLAPASAPLYVAKAKVLRAGRTLTVVRADVLAGETLTATMLGTMMRR
jgi:uncharacterized protein (TIGR00369 family)